MALKRNSAFSIISLKIDGKRGACMSSSKQSVIEKINLMPDDMDESQLIERLYMLMRLEHSQRRCETEGTFTDDEVAAHFARKRKKYSEI